MKHTRPARMRNVPSLGAFLGISVALVTMFAMVTPWPTGFGDPGGGLAPDPAEPARCLRLSYTGTDYRWLPKSIRLVPRQRFVTPPDAPWYWTGGYLGTWLWRPAGPDSIDVAGHHGPVLRLPATGTHRVGRGGWHFHDNLVLALASREWRVHATAVSCATVPE